MAVLQLFLGGIVPSRFVAIGRAVGSEVLVGD